MAARPQLRALERKIAEKHGSDEDPTGEDFVMDLIISGETIAAIGKRLGCSRGMVYNWFKLGGEPRAEKLKVARKLAAEAHVEEGIEILDKLAKRRVPPAQSEVSLAQARANYRKWLASVRDRDSFGDASKGLNVNVSIGDLHLEALKAAGKMNHEQIEEAEFELLPAGSE